jgi:PadR family transcriptional regulator PadR
MRRTQSLVRVLEALLENPQDQHWGYELQKRAKIRSGVLYPILRRLHEAGWVEDGWEDQREASQGRPPRRYYVLTPQGVTAARELLMEAIHDPRFGWLRPGAPA